MADEVSIEAVQRDLSRDLTNASLSTLKCGSDRKRERWAERLLRSERQRARFEDFLADQARAVTIWGQRSSTEQREILYLLDHWRLWPIRWEMRRWAAILSRWPEPWRPGLVELFEVMTRGVDPKS